MRSTPITKPSDVNRKWYVVDASGHTLGRLSSEIAKILRGKNKPIFSTFIDTGDNVIVINASKIKVTGKKLSNKIYTRNSGWIGGIKQITLRESLKKKPTFALEHAVKGMLPKNTLGDHMFKKLHVYAGAEHTHAAQQPEPLTITY
ncbi:MAG: 50S ribosomal protein L13 [Clostridiales bacterium]|jgi:large subunit ribosomal protein L13|nr:50S ribosomal protein L13 [Clostridiales bacterium]